MDVIIGVCGPPTKEMLEQRTPSALERISGSFRRITQ